MLTKFNQHIQEINKQTKQYRSKPKNNIKDNPHTNGKTNIVVDYSVLSPDTVTDHAISSNTTPTIPNEFVSMFTVIGFFKATFSLKVKYDAKPHQEMLKGKQILAQPVVDETAEWYNSFVIVPKPNGTVR